MRHLLKQFYKNLNKGKKTETRKSRKSKGVWVFDELDPIPKVADLLSVGSCIFPSVVVEKNFTIYPLDVNGDADWSFPTPLSEIDKEGDWYLSLDKDDKEIVDNLMKKL